MSYETKIDEMVGQQVAEFQRELSLAKRLEDQNNSSPMPLGPEGGDRTLVEEGETGAIGWLWRLLTGTYGSTCAAGN